MMNTHPFGPERRIGHIFQVEGSFADVAFTAANKLPRTHFGEYLGRGEVGELPIAENHTISMMWETGVSDIVEHTAMFCDYHNESCYYAKTVPVIFSVDRSAGFYTGGQNLTVTGHGF